MNTVLLHTLAHARTGDKGNRSSISLIAFDARHWPLLVEHVTFACVSPRRMPIARRSSVSGAR